MRGGCGDHERVEDLVVAESPGPRIGSLFRVNDRAGGIGHTAGGEQDERGGSEIAEYRRSAITTTDPSARSLPVRRTASGRERDDHGRHRHGDEERGRMWDAAQTRHEQLRRRRYVGWCAQGRRRLTPRVARRS